MFFPGENPYYIHWNIRHDYYLVIAFDEYYLEKREAYHKYHYKHYNLLYGYDDTERVYYLMGYGKTNTPVVSKITYDMVNEKSIVAEKVTRYKYATNLVTLFKFDINSVITGLYELLHNIDSSKKHANLLIEEPVTYGIDNLKILATTEVGRADIRQDKRIAFCIKEHSMMMLERLNYLHKHHYLKDEDYEHLLVGCNQIIHISGILLSMVLMNMVKEENNTSIERRLLELYEIEKVFLTEFLDCLKQEETRSEEM